ncbi:MAG: sulfotransferase [Cyanobacteria bacterium P01_A01_bin.40]
MQDLLAISNKLIDAFKLYVPTAYGGFKNRNLWQNLETFCLFLGYPRSGHSIVGALLNAHPNIIMSHEAAALKYVYAGFSRNQVYEIIHNKAKISADKERELGGYNYYVPNQWQGRFEKPKVIGDKQGEGTVLRIAESSRHIPRLKQILNIKIKFIHVARNPYDNISTISIKIPKLGFDLEKSIAYYFYLCKTISNFKLTLDPQDIIEFKHENFLKQPQIHLENLCHFLGVSAPKDYLNDSAEIVYQSPHRSRNQVCWSPQLIESVATQINEFPFLQGYSYYD